MGVLVFLFGFYIVLRVSGLTPLALTVVGGTGLIGLALGIPFGTSPRIFSRASSSAGSGPSRQATWSRSPA
jgi:hypothetical protein